MVSLREPACCPATLGEKAGIKAILLVPFLFFAILFGWGGSKLPSKFVKSRDSSLSIGLWSRSGCLIPRCIHSRSPIPRTIRADSTSGLMWMTSRTHLMLEDELMDDSFELKRMPLLGHHDFVATKTLATTTVLRHGAFVISRKGCT